MSFIGTQQKCKASCEKTVYPVDQLSADGTCYRKACFGCSHCKVALELSKHSSMEVVLCCKPHHEQLFKEPGGFNCQQNLPVTHGPPSSMFSGTQEKCAPCGKTAYPLQKIGSQKSCKQYLLCCSN